MKAQRAQEILQADTKIDVEVNGIAVWIDSVDPARGIAKIHDEDRPAETRIVSVDQLQEIQ
ncbi:H-type small acid-soluble spore protein [Paenibacillus filicis]|uniref:H-type small acid-soluble spore protein n=1 Tax=Paenibacillus filicis TaxID=669464 RepID=A0ABU9DGW2_9BACL